ncbi:hypothetical protein BKA81DRAFT_43400 [Phyllosticta paracitricarpa]
MSEYSPSLYIQTSLSKQYFTSETAKVSIFKHPHQPKHQKQNQNTKTLQPPHFLRLSAAQNQQTCANRTKCSTSAAASCAPSISSSATRPSPASTASLTTSSTWPGPTAPIIPTAKSSSPAESICCIKAGKLCAAAVCSLLMVCLALIAVQRVKSAEVMMEEGTRARVCKNVLIKKLRRKASLKRSN